ncbi:30S ribosome-binding factor RbfA [candidate division KSB1 bacterium]|nr:MAG: 30S ribosome-binding factor RbfA [candidate division KSB1 bacterium]
MAHTRLLKIADLLKREISNIIFRQIKDPRIGFVTITQVRVSADLRSARIYCTILGTEQQRVDTLNGLNHASTFIQSVLKPRLSLRYIPKLQFFWDDTLEYAEKIEKLIQQTKSDK